MIAVTKMIGTSFERSIVLALAAVSKPVRDGHLDVEQNDGEVFGGEILQRLDAGTGLQQIVIRRLKYGLSQ